MAEAAARGAAAKKDAVKEKTWKWEGKDKKGNRVKGELMAPSEAIAKALLRKQGVTPAKVRVQSNLFGLGGKKGKKIKAVDIAIFSRQLATMMSAGVPLVQSLDIIGRGHENPNMTKLVFAVKNDLESGNPLAESLAKHPAYFDSLYVNLVDAGERSGALETLLDKIATYKEKTEAIKAKVKKALFYPSAVMVVAFIVMGILLYFVVPQFQALFQGFGADLPAFTLFVIGLSQKMQAYWWVLLGGIGIAVAVFRYFKTNSRTFNRFLDRLMLKIPIVGDIVYKATVARFARTLATMFAAGVPLVEAMESVAKASGNIVFEEAIFIMRDQVSSGQQLQLTMAQAGIFPSLAVQMVAIGEESGALDEMCSKVADFYEAEVDNLVDSLSSLLEPLIMAVIGVLVGGLVVAMYLPIFKLGAVV